MLHSNSPFQITEMNNPEDSSTSEFVLEGSPITMKIDKTFETSTFKEFEKDNSNTIKKINTPQQMNEESSLISIKDEETLMTDARMLLFLYL